MDKWQNYRKTEFNLQDGFAQGTVYKWLNDEWQESPYPFGIEVYLQGQSVFFYNARQLSVYYTDITGIDDGNIYNKLIVNCFPNPASDIISIKIDDCVQKEDIRFELIDQVGRLYKYKTAANKDNLITINVSDVPSGLYVLRTTVGKYTSFKKVLIVK